MAHSIVEFHGRTKIFRDSDLLLVKALVIDRWERCDKGARPETLRPLIEHWKSDEDEYLVGCIDLGLDQLISTTDQACSLIELLERCSDDVRALGQTVPGEWLTSLVGASGVLVYFDRESSQVSGLLDAFRDFIKAGVESGGWPTF